MTNTQNPNPWIDDKWTALLQAALFQCGKAQSLSDADVYRLMALAILSTVMSHQMLSEFGGSDVVTRKLRELPSRNMEKVDLDEAEPPTLTEMVIVMDMAALAFSLIEKRRAIEITDELDISTEELAEGLLKVLLTAVAKGGVRTLATLMKVVTSFRDRYRSA